MYFFHTIIIQAFFKKAYIEFISQNDFLHINGTRVSFFHFLYRGCHQKVWPRNKVFIPISKDLDLEYVFPLKMIL